MTILVTGASSYVGAKIYEDLKRTFEVRGTFYSNQLFPELDYLDIRDQAATTEYITSLQPTHIVHIAANPSIPWCEKNPEEATKINIDGTQNIVDAANAIGAKVIFISSMSVSDPRKLYAATKIRWEELVKSVSAGYTILRPALILWLSPNTTNDRTFNRLLKNIRDKDTITCDTSCDFQPTWLIHLSEVTAAVIQQSITNVTIPVCITQAKNRYEMTRDILAPFGNTVLAEDMKDTSIVTIEDLKIYDELGLPMRTYDEMISGIQDELKGYFGGGSK